MNEPARVSNLRHHYKGPRPITAERFKSWLTEGLQSGRIGPVVRNGVDRFKTGEPAPWVEDERPEPEDQSHPAGKVALPVPEDAVIPNAAREVENLTAAFRLPDGHIIRTGEYHDWNALPKKYRIGKTGVERGFVDRAGNFLAPTDLRSRTVAGSRGGTGEAVIDEADATPSEEIKRDARTSFGLDFDDLARQVRSEPESHVPAAPDNPGNRDRAGDDG